MLQGWCNGLKTEGAMHTLGGGDAKLVKRPNFSWFWVSLLVKCLGKILEKNAHVLNRVTDMPYSSYHLLVITSKS